MSESNTVILDTGLPIWRWVTRLLASERTDSRREVPWGPAVIVCDVSRVSRRVPVQRRSQPPSWGWATSTRRSQPREAVRISLLTCSGKGDAATIARKKRQRKLKVHQRGGRRMLRGDRRKQRARVSGRCGGFWKMRRVSEDAAWAPAESEAAEERGGGWARHGSRWGRASTGWLHGCSGLADEEVLDLGSAELEGGADADEEGSPADAAGS